MALEAKLPKYAVGIPVLSEPALKDTVDSLLAQSYSPSKIYICLNGSDRETRALASNIEKESDLVEIIETDRGKTHAWNKIVAHSEYDTILMADGDIRVEREAAKHLLEEMGASYKPALVSANKIFQADNLAKKERDFIKYFLGVNLGEPINSPALQGGLYAMDRKQVKESLAAYDFSDMPSVINDDRFLGSLVATYNPTKISTAFDAHFTIQSRTNMQEWKTYTRRVIEGNIQLEREFSYLDLGFGSYQRDGIGTFLKRTKNDSFLVKVRSLFGLAHRRLTIMSIRQQVEQELKKSDYSYRTTWDPLLSTKQPAF